jgi:hypothetical protein
MRSTPALAPAAILSIGSAGTTPPSITGSNGIRFAGLTPLDGVGHHESLGAEHDLGFVGFRHRYRCDRGAVRRHAELIGEIAADPRRRRGRKSVVTRAALGDDPLEKTLGARHREKRRHAHAAGRLAEDGDVGVVPPESGDVVPHPFQCRDLVEQAEVGDSVAQEQEAVDAEPVVDADQDHAIAREPAAIVVRHSSGSVGEGAAVDPDHRRQPGGRRVGRPDVQVEAVLALDRRLREDRVEGREIGRLRHRGAERERVPGPFPGRGRLRRPEAVGGERRGGVGDAFE